MIARQKNAGGKRTVHRSKFLDELVKDVPSHRSHFNKRLVGIEDKPGSPVSLQFTDGTTATTDAVIGADGIHSAVRAHLLGEESAQPTFAGSTVYRGLIPMERAIEKLGDEYAYNSYMVCGPGGQLLQIPPPLFSAIDTRAQIKLSLAIQLNLAPCSISLVSVRAKRSGNTTNGSSH